MLDGVVYNLRWCGRHIEIDTRQILKLKNISRHKAIIVQKVSQIKFLRKSWNERKIKLCTNVHILNLQKAEIQETNNVLLWNSSILLMSFHFLTIFISVSSHHIEFIWDEVEPYSHERASDAGRNTSIDKWTMTPRKCIKCNFFVSFHHTCESQIECIYYHYLVHSKTGEVFVGRIVNKSLKLFRVVDVLDDREYIYRF